MSSGYYAFLVFLGGCSYGILSTIVKTAYGAGLSLSDVAGGQVFWGAVIFWLAAWKRKPKQISLKKTVLLILSGMPMGMTSIFYYRSLETLDASLAIVFLFQFVWIGTLFEMVFFKKFPSFQKTVSIIILLIGSAVAAGLRPEGNFEWSPGIFWGGLSAVSYSLVILASGTAGGDVPPVFKGALMSLGAAFVIFLYLPPLFLTKYDLFISVLPYGVLLGLFGIVIPPFLFSVGIPRTGPGLGSILTSSELPAALLTAAFVLKETVDMTRWWGAFLILIGIILGNREHRK